MIQINNLSKVYNKNTILDNLTINIDNNYIYLIIGSNGSGKSTLLKCINNLVSYYGTINIKGSISYMPESINLPDNLKVNDFLNLLKGIKNKTFNNLNYLIDVFKLNDHLYKNISKLSFGTKQKILLVITLLEDSDIYLFDEPLNGLDNESIKIYLDEINKLNQKSKLIIIVTHEEDRIKLDKIKVIKLKTGKIHE